MHPHAHIRYRLPQLTVFKCWRRGASMTRKAEGLSSQHCEKAAFSFDLTTDAGIVSSGCFENLLVPRSGLHFGE